VLSDLSYPRRHLLHADSLSIRTIEFGTEPWENSVVIGLISPMSGTSREPKVPKEPPLEPKEPKEFFLVGLIV
jgi:hypothetical protein